MAVDSINLIPVLEQTLNGDRNQLLLAQQNLEQACAKDAGSFLLQLSNILRTTTNKPAVRTAAGIQLKNFLATPDIAVRKQNVVAWKLIDPQRRSQIKENVLETLGTEHMCPYGADTAPSVVSALAGVEIPVNEWPELFPSLHKGATGDSTQELRQACLKSISRICEDVDGSLLLPFANFILTAIIFGINPQHASEVRLAATSALKHAVDFCKDIFDDDHQRGNLMRKICVAMQFVDASRSTDNTDTAQLRVAELQCVSRIITLYYEHMGLYMKELCAISCVAMQSEVDEIAMQGIELWSTLAEEERDLKNIERENALDGRATVEQNYHFVNAALGSVCPLLLEALKRTDVEDEWTVAKAASVCLMFLAQATGDDVLVHVRKFFGDNIENPDWRCRDAAATAIGSILEGPDAVKLHEIVEKTLPFIFGLMQDSSDIVCDSASWTVARICEHVKEAVLLDTDKFGKVLHVLLHNLQSTPTVAAHSCCTLASLVEASYNYAVETMPPAAAGAQRSNGTADETTCEIGSPYKPDMCNADRDFDNIPSTYLISSELFKIVTHLFHTARRPDATQANLRPAVYEALSEIVKHSARDCASTVNSICDYLLHRSSQLIEQQKQKQAAAASGGSSNELPQDGDLLELILPVINVCLRRLPALPDVLSTQCMKVSFELLELIRSSPSVNGGPEAFMILSTLVMKLQNSFLPHLPHLGYYVVWAIGGDGNADGNNTDHTLSGAACALLSEICKSSLGPNVRSDVPNLGDRPGLMERLVSVIKRTGHDPSNLTRIIAISCIGDIAMLLNADFAPYIAGTFDTLFTCLYEEFESPVYLSGNDVAAVAGGEGAPSFSPENSVANNINGNAAAGTAATSRVGRDDGEGENSVNDWLDQRIDLRDSIIECFATIVDSLRYASDHHQQQQPDVADQQVLAQAADLLRPYGSRIMAAILECCLDGELLVNEAAVRRSAGLVVSLTLIFGVEFLACYPQMDVVFDLLNPGNKMRSCSAATKIACTLVAKQIKRAKKKAALAGNAVMPQQHYHSRQLSFAGNNAAMPGTQSDAPSQMGSQQPLMLNDNNNELLYQHSPAHYQSGGAALQAVNNPGASTATLSAGAGSRFDSVPERMDI